MPANLNFNGRVVLQSGVMLLTQLVDTGHCHCFLWRKLHGSVYLENKLSLALQLLPNQPSIPVALWFCTVVSAQLKELSWSLVFTASSKKMSGTYWMEEWP